MRMTLSITRADLDEEELLAVKSVLDEPPQR